MITLNKLKIFKRYKGDGDAFVRAGSKKEKEVLDYSDWKMIDEFIQDIGMINKGMVSEDYKKRVESKIKEACDNQDTIEKLINMSK